MLLSFVFGSENRESPTLIRRITGGRRQHVVTLPPPRNGSALPPEELDRSFEPEQSLAFSSDTSTEEILVAHAPGESGRAVRPVALTHNFDRRIYRVACCGTELDLARTREAVALIEARVVGFQYSLVSTDEIALEEETPLPRMLGPRARLRAEYKLLYSALLRGRIDIIVASFPDLEPGLDRRLDIAAVLERRDARDVLVLKRGESFTTLAAGARIGLGSRRQELQLLHLRPDLIPQRVTTPLAATLQRVAEGDIDGAIVAAADLYSRDFDRFRGQLFFAPFSLDAMTPQPGQGQVVLLVAAAEHRLLRLLHDAVDHAPSRHTLEAEALAAFSLGYADTNADPPAAAYVSVEDGQLMLLAMNASADPGTPQTTRRPISPAGSMEADPDLIRAAVQSLLGRVAFVGAGPGSPDLMTIRGRRLLAEADVIVHDRASTPSLLPHASPQAEQIYLESGDEKVAERLIALAREGRRVVRLTGGDPFLFDCGAQEAMALHEAGIAYELVPGVSAALAAPAFAGIPMTYLDWSRDVHIIDAAEITGQLRHEGRFLQWANLSGTLVFVHVVTRLPELTAGLLQAGMPERTPVALIQDGSMPTQRVWYGELGTITGEAVAANLLPPAVLVVGQVTTLGEDLAWWPGHGTLTGRTVALVRGQGYGQQQSGGERDPLAAELAGQGARVYEIALVTNRADSRIINHLDEMLAARLEERGNLRRNDRSAMWIVVGSADGARAFGASLRRLGVDMRRLANVKFAALSRETAAALAEIGLQADYVAGRRGPEELATELANTLTHGDQVLSITGPVSEPVIGVVLQVAGVRYEEVVAYEQVTHLPGRQALIHMLDDIDYMIFRSDIVVQAFVDGLRQNGIQPKELDGEKLVVFAENEESQRAALREGLPMRGWPLSWSRADIMRQIEEVNRNRGRRRH